MTPDQPEKEFAEARQDWKLEQLYADLASAKQKLAPHKRKGLTQIEKRHLLGLLSGYSPTEIACILCKNTRGVEADLCKTLYRYIETLTLRLTNTLKNWRDVVDWLEEAGYKTSSNQFQESDLLESSTSTFQFIVGPPIDHPRYFFGRERELKRIFNLLKSIPLQNAAVIGPRRSGKTSLLRYLERITITPAGQLRSTQRTDWLPMPEHYQWIFVDFQDPRVGSQKGLLRYLLTGLNLPIPNPCDLERFLDVMSYNLKTPTVILLDEIGAALLRYPELNDSFWESLRSLATNYTGGKLAFVLASHESPVQLAHHAGHSSPFFNIFGYTTTLGPLTEPEACALVANSPIPFPVTDIEWLLLQSGRWPLLLQILCRERLAALEDGETDDAWQEDGLRQIAPFQHLLEA